MVDDVFGMVTVCVEHQSDCFSWSYRVI